MPDADHVVCLSKPAQVTSYILHACVFVIRRLQSDRVRWVRRRIMHQQTIVLLRRSLRNPYAMLECLQKVFTVQTYVPQPTWTLPTG